VNEVPVVFANSYEALVRVLGNRLDASVYEKLLNLGVDVRRLNPAYPYDLWVRSLEVAMEVLWPGKTKDQQAHSMGRAIFESYGQTVMGKALLRVIQVLGPKRALARMARNLRTTNNYSQTELRELGENEYELWVNRVAFPNYFVGVLEAGLGFAGATDLRVELVSYELEAGAVFRLSWR
jgi:uncharacterized protein (TIGR02265 family)